jgi:DDE family transposase
MKTKEVSNGHGSNHLTVRLQSLSFRGDDCRNNPSTTDRSKLGTKRHILTDKNGIPLYAVITSANTHDIKVVTEVIDNIVINGILYHLVQNEEENSISIYVLTEHTTLSQ